MKKYTSISVLICALLSVLSCNDRADEQKSFALIVGTDSAYWDKVRQGAIEEGKNLGYNVTVYNYPSDEAYGEVAEYIKSLNNVKGLVGVAGLANEETLDAAYGTLNENISIVVAEGVFVKGGAVSKRYRGTVALNYKEYATAFTDKIPESKLLVISYDKGANAEIAAVITNNREFGDVVVCPVGDQREVPEILKDALEAFPDIEAVIFNSSNFVNDENLGLCGGRTIYSSDLNAAVAPAIRDGRIALNISIDNYEFGANMVRALAEIEKQKSTKSIVQYGIPYLFTDKNNIDSPDRQRLYE